MSKHTPGPWTIERNERGTSIKAIGPLQAEEYAGSAWLDVSDVDARLIAAAPDLLEALKDLLPILDKAWDYDGDVFGRLHNDAVDAWRQARAAIAKATGETQ